MRATARAAPAGLAAPMLVMIFTPLRDAGRQHRVEAIGEQRVVARIRVAPPRLLRERDRALRQALEHQIVQFAALGEV